MLILIMSTILTMTGKEVSRSECIRICLPAELIRTRPLLFPYLQKKLLVSLAGRIILCQWELREYKKLSRFQGDGIFVATAILRAPDSVLVPML